MESRKGSIVMITQIKRTPNRIEQAAQGLDKAQGNALPSRQPAIQSPYITTEEAAAYMRKSVSWLIRRKDIPYYRGKPNLYKSSDLDAWMETKRKHEPLAA